MSQIVRKCIIREGRKHGRSENPATVVPTEFPAARRHAAPSRAALEISSPALIRNNMEITSGSTQRWAKLDFRKSGPSIRRICRRSRRLRRPQSRSKKRRRESTSRFSFVDLSTTESFFRVKVNFQVRIKSQTNLQFLLRTLSLFLYPSLFRQMEKFRDRKNLIDGKS